MVEWNVYVDGTYVGTVFARGESEARTAALYKYYVPEGGELSVARR